MDVDKLEGERNALFAKLAPLRELRTTVNELRNERDALNEEVKKLRDESKKLQEGRDSWNEQVKAEKAARDKLNESARELRNRYKDIYDEESVSPSNLSRLNEQIKRLTWQIETSGVDFKKEKQLRGKLKELTTERNAIKEKDDMKREIAKSVADAKKHHRNVLELSSKSEQAHAELVTYYEKIKDKSSKATEKHKEFLEQVEKLKNQLEEHQHDAERLKEIGGQIRKTRDEIKEKEQKELKENFEERANKAIEMFKAGEKVDLRELQIQLSLEGDKEVKKK